MQTRGDRGRFFFPNAPPLHNAAVAPIIIMLNLLRLGGDMAHLTAIVLLPYKLHASRSAAGDMRLEN